MIRNIQFHYTNQPTPRFINIYLDFDNQKLRIETELPSKFYHGGSLLPSELEVAVERIKENLSEPIKVDYDKISVHSILGVTFFSSSFHNGERFQRQYNAVYLPNKQKAYPAYKVKEVSFSFVCDLYDYILANQTVL